MPDEEPPPSPRPNPPPPPEKTEEPERDRLDSLEEALAELSTQSSPTEGSSAGSAPAPEGPSPTEAPTPPPGDGTSAVSEEEVARLRSELALAIREKEAAQGDAEQLASESRDLSSKLTLARSELERERGALRSELESERERRTQLEKDLEEARAQVEGNLRELAHHRGGKEESEKLRSGWEKAESDLREKEAELAKLRTESEQELDARAAAETRAEGLQVEVDRLTQDLNEVQERATRLQGELETAQKEAEELRARPAPEPATPAPPAPAPGSPPAAGAPRIVPSVPVFFMSGDGKSVAKQAFFAVGKGEALEAFLSLLLGQWRSSKLPVIPSVSPEGVTVSLKGDPYRRSMKFLPSGAIQVQLSPPELKEVADLPKLVSRKKAVPAT